MMFGLRGLQLFPLSVEMHDSLMAICQVPKAKFQMEISLLPIAAAATLYFLWLGSGWFHLPGPHASAHSLAISH